MLTTTDTVTLDLGSTATYAARSCEWVPVAPGEGVETIRNHDGSEGKVGTRMKLADAIRTGSMLTIARAYVAAGLSVIPVKADGSKSPKITGWRKYSEVVATDDELVSWFSDGSRVGLGVVPGPASGNLVVLDFECRGDQPAYSEWIQKLTIQQRTSLATCPIIRTPSGGRHVWVRLAEQSEGGRLARYANGKTKAEVRGLGHQVLAPGCPAECHASGQTYEFESWGWLT